NMLSFVQCLRRAGLPVSTDQVRDFVRALTLVDIGQRIQVYHAACCLLVNRHEHLKLFETIFNVFWNTWIGMGQSAPQKAPRAPRHDQPQQPVLISYMASKARPHDPELDVIDKSATYSDVELLGHKDFSQMTPDE